MMSSMSNRFLERERDLKNKKKTDRETSFEKEVNIMIYSS